MVTEWSGGYAPRGTSVREARARARLLLTVWRWSGDVEDAVLIVSELVTNAVRHAARPGRVLVLRLAVLEDGTLLVDVSDPVAGLGPTGAAAPECGRGLGIVRTLSSGVEWFLRPHAGKTVRARVPGSPLRD
ncbi:ATP-binding protein [Streptomyces triticagri]|uniref:ATP-binding protein n=1 Tax=Streptomyces triticagri TaxID=2293568 RepID=UPI001F2D9EF0|nr:ATP-binding protein [Streptomyces triticagri]